MYVRFAFVAGPVTGAIQHLQLLCRRGLAAIRDCSVQQRWHAAEWVRCRERPCCFACVPTFPFLRCMRWSISKYISAWILLVPVSVHHSQNRLRTG